jgi:acyl dehydratase
MVRFQDGMTAGAALAAAGVALGDGKAISVGGRRARAETPVRAGDTVALQPKAENG